VAVAEAHEEVVVPASSGREGGREGGRERGREGRREGMDGHTSVKAREKETRWPSPRPTRR